jgi:hypothetical protein
MNASRSPLYLIRQEQTGPKRFGAIATFTVR